MAQRMYFMNRAAYITHLMAWRQAEVLIVGFLLHGGLMPATMPPMPAHAAEPDADAEPADPAVPAADDDGDPGDGDARDADAGAGIMGQQMFVAPGAIAPPP